MCFLFMDNSFGGGGLVSVLILPGMVMFLVLNQGREQASKRDRRSPE